MKKYLLSILFTAVLLTVPAAAAGLFPVDATAMDGETSWGYMNEDGRLIVPFEYASASAFREDGLAVVTREDGVAAVIDEAGEMVVPFGTEPCTVEFGDDKIALQYENETVYYSKTGEKLDTIAGASGFAGADGCIAVQRDGLWGYTDRAGAEVIAPQYQAAGSFSGGRAVVQRTDGRYAVIDTENVQTLLPQDAVPAYMEVYDGKMVILSNGSRLAVYSLETGALASEYLYQEISPFRDGYAMARLNSYWGILSAKGTVTLPFEYNYLSYMGEGIYAARGADGYVSAIDSNGNLVYRTYTYVGGFQSIEHGLSWHGTMDNDIIFFSRQGGYVTRLANAENPVILTGDVARVTVGGKRQYVRLHDNRVLYAPERSYDLKYFKVTTTRYEKYLGMKNGAEYGWDVTYPVISGLADRTVQQKLNSAIENFFLEGPSFSARRQPLNGSYGLRVQGSVLIVWADCISGLGDGASVWNDNIMLDLATGERYQVVRDLFVRDYLDVVGELLPGDIPYYMFSYPRVTGSGVCFYRNYPQDASDPEHRTPTTEEYELSFREIGEVIRKDGALWRALGGADVDTLGEYQGYTDVPKTYWAYAAIKAVSEADLMQGADGAFRPNDPITAAEAAAVLVRLLAIDTGSIAPPDGAPWYYIEAAAAEQAGLTDGLEQPVLYTAALLRADAMQMLGNVLGREDIAWPEESDADAALSRFTDVDAVPTDRRQAAALCVREGLIVGAGGRLDAAGVFTRAQFAQILSRLLAKGIAG